ncbi:MULTISPECIES: TetR/AcrR family transcriptional regulator C-terminal ligand-binding domain-containing protein [unclassified Streptomyces]|uniref:TetR/AcrR family transcriptional regulator n=1 Tax=unclassified Streptomyces TaxID=2593676 RepID=UPI0036E1E7F2
MSSLAEGHPRQAAPVRGRPRSEAVERAIVEGVLKLLEDGVPLAELSIERIARTAGVGKATIYRRWSGKEELFVDVVRATEPPDPELPGTSMRDDLVAILEQLRQRGLMTRSSALLRSVFAQMKSSPKLWEAYHAIVVTPRRQKQYAILRRGQANGELRTDLDVELLNDLLVGPMLFRTIMQPDADLPEGLSEQVVDSVLQGLRPVSSPSVSSPTP